MDDNPSLHEVCITDEITGEVRKFEVPSYEDSIYLAKLLIRLLCMLGKKDNTRVSATMTSKMFNFYKPYGGGDIEYEDMGDLTMVVTEEHL